MDFTLLKIFPEKTFAWISLASVHVEVFLYPGRKAMRADRHSLLSRYANESKRLPSRLSCDIDSEVFLQVGIANV